MISVLFACVDRQVKVDPIFQHLESSPFYREAVVSAKD